jgi:hypothetical protein
LRTWWRREMGGEVRWGRNGEMKQSPVADERQGSRGNGKDNALRKAQIVASVTQGVV